MFPYTESLSVAMTVLEIVDTIVSNSTARPFGSAWVEAMDNGREQGLALYSSYKGNFVKFMVAQSRGSDSIVIYESTRYGDNTPTDEEYRNQVTYSYNQPYEAAEYIVERLNHKREMPC